jgi:acyl-CoA thioester hydrolase
MGDTVAIDLQLVAARRDFSRWTIRHQLFKNTDTLAAILTVDGAFFNTAFEN